MEYPALSLAYWLDRSPHEAEEWASRHLIREGVDSSTRALVLIDLLMKAHMPSAHQWAIVQAFWPLCDAIQFEHIAAMAHALGGKPPNNEHLKGEDLSFYDSLPEAVTIYRGASPAKRHGWSWTTSETVAEGFARGHRGIRVPDGTVYTADVNKSEIWTVFTERGEHEVFINPAKVKAVRVHQRMKRQRTSG